MRHAWIVPALCLLLSTLPLAADEGAWTPIGPDGGDVSALAVAPSRPTLLYAATQTGSVFKSLDRGETWSFAGWPNTPLADLAVDPRTPNLVYGAALIGILRSTDGGASWAEVQRGGRLNPIRGVEVNPHNGIAFGLSARTLWRSNDRGVTWKTEGRWPEHVFQSTDGGATWTPLGTWPGWSVRSGPVIDPVDPSILYVGTGETSVWRFDTDDE